MQLLDSITVYHQSTKHEIELYHGDLSAIPPELGVDTLVVSAYRDNYDPTPGTLIGALHAKGLSVKELAEHKTEDLRENYDCWLSNRIDSERFGFKYLLCWEPAEGKMSTVETVSDISKVIMPFANRFDIESNTLAMPLLATGNQGLPPIDVLESLLDMATYWIAKGLPVDKLMIVEYDSHKAKLLQGAFTILKKKYTHLGKPQREFQYDVFISYSHKNMAQVQQLKDALLREDPYLEIFLDTQDLHTGVAWQQELYNALENSRKVLAVYTPGYLESKVCNEEFNIAMFRHRESNDGVLVPVYLESCHLPTYMKLIQFIDIRDNFVNNPERMAQQIVAALQ